MRISTICLLVLALATAAVTPVSAQLDPCEPDCLDTEFEALQNHVITLPGNCKINVTYATRLACGIWQDLYIEHIRTVPTPPSPACQHYWDMGPKDLLWIVTQKMAEDNPMDFAKPEPGCATDWRVIKGPCWFQDLNPGPERYSSSYCEESICCLEPYQVCFDECGNVTCFEPQSPYASDSFSCDLSHPGSCEPACGNPSWSEGGSCP